MLKEGAREQISSRRIDGGCPNTTSSHLHYDYRIPRYFKCDNINPSVCLREFIVYRHEYDVCYM